MDPKSPMTRFRESTVHRRLAMRVDAWAARIIRILAWGVGVSMLTVVTFLAVESLRSMEAPGAPRVALDALASGHPREPDGSAWLSLWWGSLNVTLMAMVVAVPPALAAAVQVSQATPERRRRRLAAVIRAMAGIPTVVVGFLVLVALRRFPEGLFPPKFLVVGVAVGLAILPAVYSAAEEALDAVPARWIRAARALGASRWEAVVAVVLPAAAPGLWAAILTGAARAMGETVLVLLIGSSVAAPGWGPTDTVGTVPASLAIDSMGKTTFVGGPWHPGIQAQALLLLGLCAGLHLAACAIRDRQVVDRPEGGT